MRILFYTMNWYPFEGSVQSIYGAILKYLKQQGHRITILTSIPYFLKGRSESWPAYKGKIFCIEYWNEIKVIRVFVPSHRFLKFLGVGLRVFNFAFFILNSLIAAFFIKKHDVILCVSHPPIFVGLNSYIISKIKKCRYIYCLQDIYPDILFDLKILKKGLLFKFLKKIELFIYNKACRICVLSSAMADNIIGKGVSKEKVRLISHFADLEMVRPLPKTNPLSEKMGLDSKFVVLMPGSISYRYGIETIFESAKLLRNNEDIKFVFIDRGEFREKFRRRVELEKLANIQFLPFQPADMFPYVLASADVCLVSLDQKFASYSVPSKLYNIMASSRPVIAVTDYNSELARIVRVAGCGVNVSSSNPELLAEQITKLATNKDKCDTMGREGRKYAEIHFGKDDICKKYDDLICNMAGI